MIPYIYHPKIDIDTDYIKELAFSDRKISCNGSGFRFLVNGDPVLTRFREKYPFMSDVYNIINHRPFNISLSPHVDTGRNAALNIPVSPPLTTPTIFYKLPEVYNYSVINHLKMISGDLTEVFRNILDRPTIINTSIPHSAVNIDSTNRVVFTWTIDKQYSFEDAVKFFSECEQD